jgi:hypothetical protein
VGCFSGGFGAVGVLLKFRLEGVLEECSAFGEKKRVQVINDFGGEGLGGDHVALIKEGFEWNDEQVANGGGFGLHKVRPCKKVSRPIVYCTHNGCTHPLSGLDPLDKNTIASECVPKLQLFILRTVASFFHCPTHAVFVQANFHTPYFDRIARFGRDTIGQAAETP